MNAKLPLECITENSTSVAGLQSCCRPHAAGGHRSRFAHNVGRRCDDAHSPRASVLRMRAVFARPTLTSGFATTAAYFETLARKNRDQERRQRLMEWAGSIVLSPELFPACLQVTRVTTQCCF
jgi:hypothetical protein